MSATPSGLSSIAPTGHSPMHIWQAMHLSGDDLGNFNSPCVLGHYLSGLPSFSEFRLKILVGKQCIERLGYGFGDSLCRVPLRSGPVELR